MILEEDKKIILKYAKEYKLSSVILFGSALTSEIPNDIDLGVKGLRPELFFDFCWKVYQDLSRPIDIIDLSKKSSFNDLIERDGIVIYG